MGDEADAVVEALRERWGDALEPGETLNLELPEIDLGFHARFVVSRPNGERLEFAAIGRTGAAGLSGEALRLFVYDALDAVLGEWLEGGRRERLRGVWEERALAGRPLLVRAGRSHPGLVEEADALLGNLDSD